LFISLALLEWLGSSLIVPPLIYIIYYSKYIFECMIVAQK